MVILRSVGTIRKPSEVSKKNQRTDKRRGSSQVRHEGGKTTRS